MRDWYAWKFSKTTGNSYTVEQNGIETTEPINKGNLKKECKLILKQHWHLLGYFSSM